MSNDASENISQQLVTSGVIPGQLVGQSAVSKTYVDNLFGTRRGFAEINGVKAIKPEDSINVVIPAINIPYDGLITGAGNAQQAIDNLKLIINNLIVNGDSSVEAAAARVSGPYSTAYATLKDRLDKAEQRFKDVAIYNVKEYGAKGDGTTDDTAAFKAAAADVLLKGGTLYIPPGRFVIKDQINIDFSTYATTKKALNIRGDNPNTTVLINNTAGKYIFKITGKHFTYPYIGNLTMLGTDINTDRGLDMNFVSECYIENVNFQNFFLGTTTQDVVRCKFNSCTWNQNKNGMYGNDQVNESTPNAIDFFGCAFYGNAEAGLYVKGGCNVNFFGGTVETNGHLNNGGQRWGVRLQDLGRYGAGGASFFGTYFEGNANIADVWINESTYPSTYTFMGCTFNKFAAPLNNDHNIRVDAGSFVGPNGYPILVVVGGCAFRDYGNTPSANTQYIKFYSGGAPVTLKDLGNYYQNIIEKPTAPTNSVFATGRITNLNTTPAIWRASNVASVSKVGTGVYQVNFIFPAVSNRNITTIGTDILGYARVANETENGFQIQVYNTAGTATDPGQITFITCE